MGTGGRGCEGVADVPQQQQLPPRLLLYLSLHALLSCCPARPVRTAALRALLPCSPAALCALLPCSPVRPAALQPCAPCCPVCPARPAALLPCAPRAPCSPVRPAHPAALLPCAPCCLVRPAALCTRHAQPPPPFSSIPCCRCSSGVRVWGWRVCEPSPAPPPPPPSPTAAAVAEGGGCVGAEGVVLGGDVGVELGVQQGVCVRGVG
ncbi:unnamed protein product [Closterium sp. NIES-54]